ncbi:hypothetical protein B296_00012679 [Ensete ventricosum]|uniref:Uncharacterized protein n=1 Tax=Ensete ventricosum TaxID=4639 RepID=A0A427B8V1_ENSVE|nr:hypothetical protein B296_00012679 [Ensete ventricosum]
MASSPSTISGFTSAPSSSSVPLPQVGGHRSSGSKSGRFKPCSSSLGIMTQTDIKALKASEVKKSCHDFDSTLTVEYVVMVRKHNNILDEYALHASSSVQCPYHVYHGGFSISVDALEARLRGRHQSGFLGYVAYPPFLAHALVHDLFSLIVWVAEMVNLDLIHGAPKIGGCPRSASRALTPVAPTVQLSSNIEEVRAESIVKEGIKASGK